MKQKYWDITSMENPKKGASSAKSPQAQVQETIKETPEGHPEVRLSYRYRCTVSHS